LCTPRRRQPRGCLHHFRSRRGEDCARPRRLHGTGDESGEVSTAKEHSTWPLRQGTPSQQPLVKGKQAYHPRWQANPETQLEPAGLRRGRLELECCPRPSIRAVYLNFEPPPTGRRQIKTGGLEQFVRRRQVRRRIRPLVTGLVARRNEDMNF